MDFSIIIPVYNSIESLPILLDEIQSYFMDTPNQYEVIFVNDASRQETLYALERLKHVNSKMMIKLIHLPQNMGQQKALALGLIEAVGTYALTMDDDLQHDIRALDSMLDCTKQDGADLVFGVYKEYGEKKTRELGSKLVGLFFKMRFKKLNGHQVSSLRLIHRSVYQRIRVPLKPFVYLSAELLPYSNKVGNVNVLRRQRLYGKSGYTLIKCIRIGIKLALNYGLYPPLLEGVKTYETHPNGRRG